MNAYINHRPSAPFCQAGFWGFWLDHSGKAGDDLGMAVEFKIDTKGLEEFAQALKLYPKEMRKPVSRYLRDEVYNFKKFAVDILEGTYTIRDRKFVEGQGKGQAWELAVPNQNTPIDEQRGAISSRRIEDGKRGLFTGWSEEIEGEPREMRSKNGRYHRTIGPNAREGGSMGGKVSGKYRLRAGGEGYNSDKIPDSSQYGLPILRFLAMLYKSMEPAKVKNEFDYFVFSNGRKRKKHFTEFYKQPKPLLGKNKVFIMGGPESPLTPRGLFAFVDGKVKRMQTFYDEPVKPKNVQKFDWQSVAVEQMQKKFTPGYIWEKYIAPAVNALFSKK
jgi:hypothetical protein